MEADKNFVQVMIIHETWNLLQGNLMMLLPYIALVHSYLIIIRCVVTSGYTRNNS
jgi:hypothetical protein